MISGYDNELYNDYLKGWDKKEYRVASHSSKCIDRGVKPKRTEVIWYNYKINHLFF
jgi:hypothetical protein